LGLIASNSGLPLAPSSRPACGLLTIDTTATPPELGAAFLGAHSASWIRRPKCPPASAGRSTSIYILALVPTVHDVIHGPGIFNAQLARHGQPLPTRPRGVNSDTCRVLRKPLPGICDIAFAARRPSIRPGAHDALEAIIRLARGIPVRIWPPVRDRLGTGYSDTSQTTAILADTPWPVTKSGIRTPI
jgi:hypothetical protein